MALGRRHFAALGLEMDMVVMPRRAAALEADFRVREAKAAGEMRLDEQLGRPCIAGTPANGRWPSGASFPSGAESFARPPHTQP